ncbi:MAG TPA: BamA/TamA family outer membrane protein, partial [Rhodospirillaceae bacterium]|nr:BamA/TamA family outer membrane protein [Rhodospirillaceae bacterium]
GQDLNIQASLAMARSSISLGFTEPYFLDRRVAAGFDIFAITSSPLQSLVYAVDTLGFDLRSGYYYNEYLSHTWKYTASMTNVHDVQPGASIYIVQQQGITSLSSISHTLLFDRRDSKVDPTSGYYLRGGNEIAGLGGSEHFLRNSAGAGQYFKVGEESVLMLSTSGGYMFSTDGSPIRINERYYLGGDTLRGFRDAGVSPRDPGTDDALGGLWEATATAEMKFPLGLPKELGVQGKLFADVGTVGPTDPSIPKSSVTETSAPRASVGTGVVWRSPMGPINVDLGIPVMKQLHDQTQVFRLNFGTRF